MVNPNFNKMVLRKMSLYQRYIFQNCFYLDNLPILPFNVKTSKIYDMVAQIRNLDSVTDEKSIKKLNNSESKPFSETSPPQHHAWLFD